MINTFGYTGSDTIRLNRAGGDFRSIYSKSETLTGNQEAAAFAGSTLMKHIRWLVPNPTNDYRVGKSFLVTSDQFSIDMATMAQASMGIEGDRTRILYSANSRLTPASLAAMKLSERITANPDVLLLAEHVQDDGGELAILAQDVRNTLTEPTVSAFIINQVQRSGGLDALDAVGIKYLVLTGPELSPEEIAVMHREELYMQSLSRRIPQGL